MYKYCICNNVYVIGLKQNHCNLTYIVSLYELPRIVKFIESETTMVGVRGRSGRVEGIRSYCLMGTEFQFRKVTPWEMNDGESYTTM